MNRACRVCVAVLVSGLCWSMPAAAQLQLSPLEYVSPIGITLGPVYHTNGTASLPSVTFAGDTDTGVYWSAANTFGISTAGISRLTIDSAGNVGIGTTGPLSKLHIEYNDATAYSASLTQGSGYFPASIDGIAVTNTGNTIANGFSSLHFRNQGSSGNAAGRITLGNGLGGSGFFAFQLRDVSHTTLTQEVMRITSSGNVGIGTTAPGSALTINGALALTTSASGAGAVVMSATAPTIASGGCTSPAVTTNNGTAKFKLTIGTSCAGVKTVTLTMPAAANEWACDAVDLTTNATYRPEQSAAASTTSVVITNYARTTGLAIDWADSEVLLVKCTGG